MSLFCTFALNKQVKDSVAKAESALKPNLLQFSSKPQVFYPTPKLNLFQSCKLEEFSQEMQSPAFFNH